MDIMWTPGLIDIFLVVDAHKERIEEFVAQDLHKEWDENWDEVFGLWEELRSVLSVPSVEFKCWG